MYINNKLKLQLGEIKFSEHQREIMFFSYRMKRQCVESMAASLYLQFPYFQAWLVDDSPLLSQVMTSTAVQSQVNSTTAVPGFSNFIITGRMGEKGWYPGAGCRSRWADGGIGCVTG